jgi:hypothetical protein
MQLHKLAGVVGVRLVGGFACGCEVHVGAYGCRSVLFPCKAWGQAGDDEACRRFPQNNTTEVLKKANHKAKVGPLLIACHAKQLAKEGTNVYENNSSRRSCGQKGEDRLPHQAALRE